MILKRTVEQYQEGLESFASNAWWSFSYYGDVYPPHTSTEVVEYNKCCLNFYLNKFYNLKIKSVLPILPLGDLKRAFYNRYNNSLDKDALISSEKLSVRKDIISILEGKLIYAVNIYRWLNSGAVDRIFKEPYTKNSHNFFKAYASVWDLVHYKVFLDNLSVSVEPENKLLCFDLTPNQMDFLYNSLKGVYISADTNRNDFFSVFNLNKLECNKRISWIHKASRNKDQLNRATLFHLIISLNRLDSYNNNKLKTEIFTFINTSFVDDQGNDFANLVEYHRNYKNSILTGSLQALTSIINRTREH